MAERVRRACGDKLKLFALEAGVEVPSELPALPTEADTIELPELPSLEDRPAVEAWCESVVQRSQERGELFGVQRGRKEGREEGLREGMQQGREEGERLGEKRGVQRGREEGRLTLTDAQREQITTCRDEATLAKWWDLAWTATSPEQILAAS